MVTSRSHIILYAYKRRVRLKDYPGREHVEWLQIMTMEIMGFLK